MCRSDRIVPKHLEHIDKDMIEYGDEDDPAILCTNQCTIYEYDEIDDHLVINHNEHNVVANA